MDVHYVGKWHKVSGNLIFWSHTIYDIDNCQKIAKILHTFHAMFLACNCECMWENSFSISKKESTDSTHTLLALSFFIDDNDVVVFNLSLGTSS